MKILYLGESWLGSCARSLREALSRNPNVDIDEISEDAYFPKPKARYLRAIGRIFRPLYMHDYEEQIIHKIHITKPDVFMVYKGFSVRSKLINRIRDMGILTVNIYPDCSPHSSGTVHRDAVSAYDLVISTKAYHPKLWSEVYGYKNQCTFVPQGYDPWLHLVSEPPNNYKYDVVLIATYRKEYGDLLLGVSDALSASNVAIAIGGHGWKNIAHDFPPNWYFPGAVQGRDYVSLLRLGKVCIAPLTRQVKINGIDQPGDVDTTRSYELPAAGCFFVHRNTEFARELYRDTGLPLFNNANELAKHINYFLEHEEERVLIAAAVHKAFVPKHSLDDRAKKILRAVRDVRSS